MLTTKFAIGPYIWALCMSPHHASPSCQAKSSLDVMGGKQQQEKKFRVRSKEEQDTKAAPSFDKDVPGPSSPQIFGSVRTSCSGRQEERCPTAS